MKNWRFLLLLALVPLLALMSSCSSDDSTTPEEEDTTAPIVTQVDPQQDDTNVPVGEGVTITFSEDMDPATANGNVLLSNGTITGFDWLDARTLGIGHTAWPEGTEITVTVQTGLTDEAGNDLAAAFAWSFWTTTTDVILQNTLPDDGATNVPLNSTVFLQFSEPMNGATLPGAISVTSPDKAMHAYTLDGNDESWTLTLDADLPASTPITVTVTTDALDEDGDPLATETSFSFTTGVAVDTTPPNLIAVEPADGSSIPTDTSYIRLIFDEPVDDDSLEPSMISGQLMFSMANQESPGVWSDNHTVFTVDLNAPLIPGAILAATFDSYADMYGNVNSTTIEWEVTVAGTADFFPVVDTYTMLYFGTWTDEPTKASGELFAATMYETKTDGEFWRWGFEGADMAHKSEEFPFVDYDRLKLTGSAVQFLGFHEEDDPVGKAETMDITFTPPVDLLRMPMVESSWSGTSTFSPVPVEGPTQVEYTITVHPGVFNIEHPGFHAKEDDTPPIVWLDCVKMTMEYELTDGVDIYEEGEDTIWYCPGVGPVRKMSLSTHDSDSYFTTLDLFMAGLEADFD